MDELQFKTEEFAFRLDAESKRHAETVMKLKDDVHYWRKRLQAALSDKGKEKREQKKCAVANDTFIRRLEWRIDGFSERFKAAPKNTAIWSDEFSVLGVSPMQFEFFPQGRETTAIDGFCALFLWCRAGVKLKYQLRVGSHWGAPDEDEYKSKMGHGHSTFCYLDAQRDVLNDTLIIGIDILNISAVADPVLGLQLQNRGPEAMAIQQVALLQNVHIQQVEWKIKNILQRAKDVPRGSAICSPIFSVAGVPDLLLEFYPNGIHMPADKTPRDGFCGFYVRAPSGSSIVVTLVVGKTTKGPIRADFDGNASKGLPEFCKLADQLPPDEEAPDLTIGVAVQNPKLEEAMKETTLILE
mmetsp:Transcript_63618/g.179033  ORF Transcript_63618/g.179033 Transcript_63618/m.179033 type:complete len:355 (-) Transcript_63618:51-1115(-)